MSVTGVLLAYERQVVDSAAQRNRVEPVPGTARLDADTLAGVARPALPPDARVSLIFNSDPAQPVVAQAGREPSLLLNPYTGAVINDASASWRKFFRIVEDWHRWLGGKPQSTRANLLDVANLLFLFIIASGIYIWLPAVWRWRTWRGLMFFQTRYINAKVRDFNWHHVFSFWMLLPLFVIALSGVVMSYGWANNLVYAAFGEQAPQRGGPARAGWTRWRDARCAYTAARCQCVAGQPAVDAERRREPGAGLATHHDTDAPPLQPLWTSPSSCSRRNRVLRDGH